MGEALRDEVAGPLGLDMFIGLPEDQIDRVQTLSTVSPKDCMIHTLLPSVMGSKLHFGPITFWNQVKMFKRIGKYAQKTPKAFEGFDGQDFTLTQNMFGHSTVRAGEVPSINVMTTARSLAKLGLGMINKVSHSCWMRQSHVSTVLSIIREKLTESVSCLRMESRPCTPTAPRPSCSYLDRLLSPKVV